MTEPRRTRGRRWAAAAIRIALILFLGGCAHATGGGGPFSTLVGLYRGPLNHLSAVRHGTCPMHPSCSEYARQAVAAHGELIGWFMACDRLMRCGRDEVRRSPVVRAGGGFRVADSLERNDFWWATPPPALPPVVAPDRRNPDAPAPQTASDNGGDSP